MSEVNINAETSMPGAMESRNISIENEEESFVILGSTPTPSMLMDPTDSSLHKLKDDSIATNLRLAMEKSNDPFQSTHINTMKSITPSYPISMRNSELTSSISNISTSVSIKDLSIEELQRQFNILIKENTQMKDNLMQNNNDLRREFNKIMNYQEEVRKTHEDHRTKFDETRKLVNKLKTENAQLKENIKTSTAERSYLKTENDELKEKMKELLTSLNALQSEYDSYKHRASEISTNVGDLQNENELLQLKLSQLEHKSKMNVDEKSDLEKELERMNLELKISTERKKEMNAKMNDLKNQLSNLLSNQHKCETMNVDLNAELKLCREQLQAAHLRLAQDKQDFVMMSQSEIKSDIPHSSLFMMPSASVDTISRLRQEVQNLQDQLKEAVSNKVILTMEPLSLSHPQDFSYSECNGSEIEKKVSSYEKHMQDMISWYNSHCKRIQDLQFILRDVIPENITSLDQLEPKLKELKIFSNKLCTDLTVQWGIFKSAQNNFQNIFGEYNNLVKEMESIMATNHINENVQQQEIARLKMELSESQAKILAKDELIQLKSEVVIQKQQELENIQKVKDEIQLLRAQVECYKTDFEQERDSRTRIAGEKEQLATDLRLLQGRNEQLIQEIRELTQNQQDPSASQTSTNNLNSSAGQPIFPCPLCQFAFHTLQALENHVDRCLDIQASM